MFLVRNLLAELIGLALTATAAYLLSLKAKGLRRWLVGFSARIIGELTIAAAFA